MPAVLCLLTHSLEPKVDSERASSWHERLAGRAVPFAFVTFLAFSQDAFGRSSPSTRIHVFKVCRE